MALTAKEPDQRDFKPIPEGMHPAICYGVYDLGTHYSPIFETTSRKVLIVWELPEIRIDVEREGKSINLPKSISKKYTLSLNEKAILRKDLTSWRGKSFTKDELAGFDLQKVLGVCCFLQIIHTERDKKTYANIQTIVPYTKGQKMKPENPLKFFSFEEDGSEIPDGTPEWIVVQIKESTEWTKRKVSGSYHPELDDIPPPSYEESPPDYLDEEIPF